jgi:hypothetical protein
MTRLGRIDHGMLAPAGEGRGEGDPGSLALRLNRSNGSTNRSPTTFNVI